MASVDVSILIVSFNTRELTLGCIESVYAQTRDVTFEIIVLDNASHDGSADAIASHFPDVKLIRSADNLGFARGNNVAAEHATGHFVLLLNPDTIILDHAIDRIVAFARAHPHAGVYGGRTFNGKMALDYNSCHGRPTPWSVFCSGLGLSLIFRRSPILNPEGLGRWRRDTVRAVDCITGCFFLMRRSLWKHLDGFDLRYFMYLEDTDLSIRAAKAAGPNLVCPAATLIHFGGQSEPVVSDKLIRLYRAKVQLFDKFWHPLLARFGTCMLKLGAFNRWAAFRLMVLMGKKHRQTEANTWAEVFRRRAEICS